ncbi:Cof-type HAD-IIB family hydrolase [Paenibacillus taiwanensis]|uniref:Cof-type HAD-IIB family hydrolase n=1 Tax=Paenibacillus taiwanensis TaxID=401638 RepID=UPI00041C31AF|nr:Cof-type HAD-IIB family hydrolase [Paenibacillus taiwanensis]
MNIKMVFFDLDGTIVDNESEQVPTSTIQSIKALQQKGIQVVIATGRSYLFTKSVGKLLGIHNFINCSGSYIRLGHVEVYKDPISQMDADHILQICNTNGDHLSCFGVEESYSNGLAKEMALPILKNINCHEVPSMFPNNKVEYMGMCLFLNNGNIHDYFKISNDLQFYHWGENFPNAYNIEKKGNNKAKAIQKVLDYFNVSSDEAIAFGDGINDIEMLQTVRIGIAMGNAGDQLKEKADFITKTVDNDGIHYALKTLQVI